MFLSQVHNTASTESLLQGLDFLSRSIEKKSASLKLLVESNFERFVRAKATIDNVYTEMRNQGAEIEPIPQSHSRQTSKSSGHFRRTSAAQQQKNSANKPLPSDKKKNALIKESEYGVQGIKAPLLEASVKAEEVWGLALGGKEKKEALKEILASMEKHRDLFELGTSITDSINRKDYDSLSEEYGRARRYANEARDMAEQAQQMRVQLPDSQIHQILLSARMWTDVEGQVEVFKRDVWRKLAGTHFTKQVSDEEHKAEEHIELISILLELGVEDNPIWVWLLSRYDFLKNKISATSERLRVEIEILRRKLANREKPSLLQRSSYLRSAEDDGLAAGNVRMDSPAVTEFWDQVHASISGFLSIEGGVLGDTLEFWETVNAFVEGKPQKSLPVGFDGQSRKHHRLPANGVNDLQTGAYELVHIIRDNVFTFFAEPPIEDISALFSPIPATPATPNTPLSSSYLSPTDSRFKFDPNNIPPQSPRTGSSWEKFAFWPPNATSLSGVHYLSKMLVLVGSAASEMSRLSVLDQNDRKTEQLKSLVGAVRERCVQAVCAAWNDDAECCKALEDWTRSSERRELTKMPSRFMAFESSVLSRMQKLLYLSDAVSKPGSAEVVVPPSAKLLHMVRSQFITSLYKVFSGMVENAEKPGKFTDEAIDQDSEGLTIAVSAAGGADLGVLTIESSNRVRSLSQPVLGSKLIPFTRTSGCCSRSAIFKHYEMKWCRSSSLSSR